jgi:hypothetical protein
MFQRTFKVASFGVETAKFIVNLSRLWTLLQQTFARLYGPSQIAKRFQDNRQILLCQEISRIECQRPPQAIRRFVESILLGQSHTLASQFDSGIKL